jgi:hypothetical protein
MAAVSIAIAAFLLARGDYVIGGLIGVLVVFRVMLLIATSRGRRVSHNQGYPNGSTQRFGAAGRVRQVLRGLARGEFRVAAGAIGVDASQMQRAFKGGSSIGKLADANNVPRDRVVYAIVADATSLIDMQVARGVLDPQTAQRAKARLSLWANRLVNLHTGDLHRLRNEARLGG